MSADLLRRAAEKLREAVKPDFVFMAPWTASRQDGTLLGWSVSDPEGPVVVNLARPEAQYFALMHPPVALALAVWLDAAAYRMPRDGWTDTAAMSVARAILREES